MPHDEPLSAFGLPSASVAAARQRTNTGVFYGLPLNQASVTVLPTVRDCGFEMTDGEHLEKAADKGRADPRTISVG